MRASSANQISIFPTSTAFSHATSSRRAGNFFKILDCSLGLRMMTGAGRQLTVTHRAKLPAQRLLGDRDAELLVYPLRKIDQPPAYDTVDRRDRAALDHPHNRLALHIIEPRGLTWRFAVKQAGSTPRIEPHHPVPDDLQRHPANPRRLGAGRPIVNGRQRQKPPSLRAILRLPRERAQLRCLEVPAQRYWNRHDEPPSFATSESERN